MKHPSNRRAEAIAEVAEHFPSNYNAILWLRQPLEEYGKSPSELILEDRFEDVYSSLDSLDES